MADLRKDLSALTYSISSSQTDFSLYEPSTQNKFEWGSARGSKHGMKNTMMKSLERHETLTLRSRKLRRAILVSCM